MNILEQLLAGKLAGCKRLKIAEGLTAFPKEILELADTLEILDLSGNKLKRLPDDFARLQHLKVVFLSENDFTELPAVLGACSELEMIGFKANKIAFIPDNAFPKKLRWLILTDNRIPELPATIGKCTRLQKLMLAGNNLTHLPAELASCRNLELLRISANKLTGLPGWLFTLPKLAWLAFAGNPVSNSLAGNEPLPEIAWTALQPEKVLGEGASGVISKANWLKENQTTEEVAVKVFKGEVTSDGFPADEMKATIAAGKHDNLIPVLGKIQGHPEKKQGLVFSLIPPVFRNLGNPPSFETCTRDTYPNGTIFTLKSLLAVAAGIASAGVQLHARGILHGDLYAHNILTDEEANPLFGDFGAATIYDQEDKIQAAQLEKLEVRAYGCLLEDMLVRLAPEENETEIITKLNRLKKACLQETVSERPDFKRIYKLLLPYTQISNASQIS